MRSPAVVGRLLSARDAEKVLAIPASTVRTWWQRRARTGLEAIDFDKRGRPLFRKEDLVALRDRRRMRVAPGPIEGALGRRLSAKETQERLGIPKATVLTWYRRRKTTGLYPIALDRNDRLLFWELDLIAVSRGVLIFDAAGQRIVRGVADLP